MNSTDNETPELKWTRQDGGYLSSDGEWFLYRGARMANSSCSAWLIHRRVTDDRIGRDAAHIAYDALNGDPLWQLSSGYPDTAPADFDGDLYAHDWDAGSLNEAKLTASELAAS